MAASFEDTLLHFLSDTHSRSEAPRKAAEANLKAAESNPAFPGSLAAIASHGSVTPDIRQSALLVLRTFVDKNWAGYSEDGEEIIPIEEGTREGLRGSMLELATGVDVDRKVRSAASYVVSKIANVDYPDQWPSLLPTLLHLIPNSNDAQSHGALKVLADLVEDALSEDQFFSVAREIIKVVHDVAVNQARKPLLRALAVAIFRSTFDIMDMVKEEHGPEVKAFADEILAAWSPFFLDTLKQSLPARPEINDKGLDNPNEEQPQLWRGIIALKLQVVKTLMKIRAVFPALLLPLSPVLFAATWEQLNLLQSTYKDMYVDNDEQGRLEDVDGLQISLDFLVLEELDFLQSCFRAPPVQKELEAQVQANEGVTSTPWVIDVMKLAVEYAQIPKEEEDLWDIDVSLFLAEETSVTANYTARTACGDLVIKLGEWLHQGALEGLLKYTQLLYSTEGSSWRTKEASLFLVTQLMNDFVDVDKQVTPEIASAYIGLIEYAISQANEPLLRARGYLVAGVLVQVLPDLASTLLDLTIKAINADDAEVVKVSCIKSLQGFIKARTIPAGHQVHIVHAISEYLYSKDLTEIEDSDDLLVTLVESLRAAISLDCRIVISTEGGPLDLLFSLAKHGASNFQLTMLVTETFEDIVSVLADTESYAALCAKVLPSLTGAFDVGKVTGDDPLVEFATDLLAVLTENGSEPLPPGYVAAVLPKLNRLLMASEEGGVLRSGAESIKYMLRHDHQQVFAWRDEQNRSGLEICLIIIDKLLSPAVEDNAASEVGGLAAELVEKAGQERLGPYLEQLLRAVASRLATAEAAAFIQSLILVFARLSLVGAQDVVQFLSQIEINGQSGLQVVMSKWLENSMDFAGYDEIRQNVIALSKLYSLNDQRVVQTMVKGDLIVPKSDRIMTRSKAKLNPDTYTIVPAPLKIIKVLIEELASASGQPGSAAAAAAAAEFADEDEEDEGSWEDVPSILDLGLGSTKEQLMAYGETGFTRQRDDETQAYLSEFFLRAGREDLAGFNGLYVALSDEEKVKLSTIGHV